jgi:hypothetical protein
VQSSIGLAGQFAAVEPTMTGRENLEMVARLFGHGRASAPANSTRVLRQLGLVDDADRLVRTYSGGKRRELDLGASLVGFRLDAGIGGALLAFALIIVFSFTFEWVAIATGLSAGNAQAAQGMALILVPFTFVSSACVPSAASSPARYRRGWGLGGCRDRIDRCEQWLGRLGR